MNSRGAMYGAHLMGRWGYCLTCDRWIDPFNLYVTKTREKILFPHAIRFGEREVVEAEVDEYHAYCTKCGNEIYIPTVNDMNALLRETAATTAIVEKDQKES